MTKKSKAEEMKDVTATLIKDLAMETGRTTTTIEFMAVSFLQMVNFYQKKQFVIKAVNGQEVYSLPGLSSAPVELERETTIFLDNFIEQNAKEK